MRSKLFVVLFLALAESLAMGVWFSASAVVPRLTELWGLSESQRAWLTMSVQIGFVAGALASAFLNLADRVPARSLFAVSAFAAGGVTALIPLLTPPIGPVLLLRFLTGFFLAGVYPVGMKIVATWTLKDRGLGIGLLVGALTLGTAMPHLLNAVGGATDWRLVLGVGAALAGLGALLAALFVSEGPYRSPAPPFNWRYAGTIFRQRPLVLTNLGYLGHMWELFAMWTWIPVFFISSFALRGIEQPWPSLAAFGIIAAGGLGSLLAGYAADKVGRTTVTIASLLISGACAVLIGRLYGGNPIGLTTLGLVWGFAVVADSAQFSACVSELSDREYVGTALTLQTSLGFLLTLLTIRVIPVAQRTLGWEWAFAMLALGPAVGIAAMGALRRSPARSALAAGKG